MRKIARIAPLAFALFVIQSAFAVDLKEVYAQALRFDPLFKQAQADWLSASQALPLAYTGTGAAGTGLFPNISLGAAYVRDYQNQSNRNGKNSGDFDSSVFSVNLVQPVFNVATWQSIGAARYAVRAATARYLAAAQDLINRVAVAYFEVLRANDRLDLTIAQKKQFEHQLSTAEEKFKVGLISVTGVYDAKASYDRARADEIRDRNELQDRVEDLRAITGKYYDSVLGLKSHIPLVVPTPDNISDWVKVARKQNYTIKADLNNILAVRKNIKVAESAFFPTISATAAYENASAGGVAIPPVTTDSASNQTQDIQLGISVNFPVFSGGFNIANTRQTRYDYLSANDQLRLDYSNVANGTRQAYLGIESSISEIGADQEAIVSARNKLEATKAGYIVGTRTMVNVLDSVTSLTQAQLAYADDRYNYVEGIFNLKQQSGVLSPLEINSINHCLKKSIKLSLKQPDVKEITENQEKLPSVDTDLLDINNPEFTTPVIEEKAPKPKGLSALRAGILLPAPHKTYVIAQPKEEKQRQQQLAKR